MTLAAEIRRALAAGREVSISPDRRDSAVAVIKLFDRRHRHAFARAVPARELDLPGADSLVSHHLRRLAHLLDADPPEPTR